jgi:tRNA modification GTPase
MLFDDTIAAISSAIGEGGIGIIRISGNDALKILNKIFVSINNKETLTMKSYTLRYGHIVDPVNHEEIDEVIVSYMKKPNTYTREDIVEINCHGGMVAVRRILSVVLNQGARLAEPGEYTKRAFLNGRIDLSQAEAVMDLIMAKTDESMKVALEQSEGKVSRKIKELMDQLIGVLAHIEATVDYPEDDIEDIVSVKVIEEAKIIISLINELVKTASTGRIIREGLNTVIIGKPNVGKSSLLNALIEENKAIVTEIPGTTRDIIEEYINIEGVPVKIIDTAGIRETGDIVEKIGVEKTKEYVNKSDLIIFMIDGSTELEEEDEEIIRLIKDKKAIIVINKLDLPSAVDMDYIKSKLGLKPIILASVNNEKGIDSIKKEIVNLVYEGKVSTKDICITNVRHIDILIKANESVEDGINTLKNGFPLDMASIEFKNAFLKLGEITGDTTQDDIIDRIFRDFCIGK